VNLGGPAARVSSPCQPTHPRARGSIPLPATCLCPIAPPDPVALAAPARSPGPARVPGRSCPRPGTGCRGLPPRGGVGSHRPRGGRGQTISGYFITTSKAYVKFTRRAPTVANRAGGAQAVAERGDCVSSGAAQTRPKALRKGEKSPPVTHPARLTPPAPRLSANRRNRWLHIAHGWPAPTGYLTSSRRCWCNPYRLSACGPL
jgi:hypothetical protein